MPKITINGKEIEFEKGMTVLQACELADVEIPRSLLSRKIINCWKLPDVPSRVR